MGAEHAPVAVLADAPRSAVVCARAAQRTKKTAWSQRVYRSMTKGRVSSQTVPGHTMSARLAQGGEAHGASTAGRSKLGLRDADRAFGQRGGLGGGWRGARDRAGGTGEGSGRSCLVPCPLARAGGVREEGFRASRRGLGGAGRGGAPGPSASSRGMGAIERVTVGLAASAASHGVGQVSASRRRAVGSALNFQVKGRKSAKVRAGGARGGRRGRSE